ncbi:hypothetical protein CQW23_26220 [Capsicum baccatum]|uniref:Uncharacterized protein n=1 Tax=Capsicum baccatum TaxID=33114 RepID=A0A2G2VN68_CAPBA|nr:hypothetical protein CQW23_26220 [Capsicum baccatum]
MKLTLGVTRHHRGVSLNFDNWENGPWRDAVGSQSLTRKMTILNWDIGVMHYYRGASLEIDECHLNWLRDAVLTDLLPKILKKIGLSTNASASQPTKRRRTAHFDVKTVEIRDREETPSTNLRRNMPTDKILTIVSDCVAAAKTTPSSSSKSVYHATSDEKWDEIKSFLHSYVNKKFNVLHDLMVKQHEDSNDKMDKQLVELMHMLKQNKYTSEKDIEDCCVDIGAAILDALVEAADDFSSTISESAQAELDAIMKGLAVSVNDLPLEVFKPSEDTVNRHSIFDIQISTDFPDVVIVEHQAAKTPAKRTRTKYKVFKSPYLTEYASSSKAIEDETTELKQKFAFDGFRIFDNMSRSIIEEYKEWVEEGLLKLHTKQ